MTGPKGSAYHPSVSLSPAGVGHVLALELIDAAMRHAATIGKPFCVTVLDVGGNSKAAVRMDGAPLMSIQISRDKAYTAVGFGLPTEAWVDRIKGNDQLMIGATAAIDRLVTMAGGIPLVVEGELIGAIGVSGGTPDEDRSVATAAIDAVAGGHR